MELFSIRIQRTFQLVSTIREQLCYFLYIGANHIMALHFQFIHYI